MTPLVNVFYFLKLYLFFTFQQMFVIKQGSIGHASYDRTVNCSCVRVGMCVRLHPLRFPPKLIGLCHKLTKICFDMLCFTHIYNLNTSLSVRYLSQTVRHITRWLISWACRIFTCFLYQLFNQTLVK